MMRAARYELIPSTPAVSIRGRWRSAPDARHRNPGTDLLRGLAIVLVVFNLLGLRIPLKKPHWSTCCHGGRRAA